MKQENVYPMPTLKDVVRNVLWKLIDYSEKKKTSVVPPDELKHLFKESDQCDLLSRASIPEIKEVYWNIAHESNAQDYFKLYLVEPTLNDGLSLINEEYSLKEKEKTKVKRRSNQVPILTLEALEYKYNNDKAPLKDWP